MTNSKWVEKQDGPVSGWEKLPHVFLAEQTGEMHCDECGKSERTISNRSMQMVTLIRQMDDFERFGERHIHKAADPDEEKQ